MASLSLKNIYKKYAYQLTVRLKVNINKKWQEALFMPLKIYEIIFKLRVKLL